MIPYIMEVPVLSTAHLPSSLAIEELGVLYAKYPEGYFVWMDHTVRESWFSTIRNWAERHTNSGWVRFDRDALINPDLTIFNW